MLCLLPPLLALLEDTKASVSLATTDESSNKWVFRDLVESVLVRLHGPLGRVQFRPVDLAHYMLANCWFLVFW